MLKGGSKLYLTTSAPRGVWGSKNLKFGGLRVILVAS